MCTFWKRLSAGALVLSVAAPAPALAAGAGDDRDKVRKAVHRPVASPATVSSPIDADSILLSGMPAATRRELTTDIRWHDEIVRAATAVNQQTSIKGSARPATSARRVRAQYGGGGKGAMVSMILTTVVSLGATFYLLKYMRDQQNNDDDGGGN